MKRFVPTIPEVAGVNCLNSQLDSVRSSELRDSASRFVSCLSVNLDEARVMTADLWARRCNLSQIPVHLRQPEAEQRELHGSWVLKDRWNIRPADGRVSLKEKFMRHLRPHCVTIDPRSATYADECLRSWIRKGSCRAVSCAEAAISFDKKSQRGWPWFMKTLRVPYEYFHEAEELLADGLRLENARRYPGVAGTRPQACGLGRTASWRGVIGMSMCTNILKKMVYIPVRNKLIKKTSFSAWVSRAAVDQAVTSMLKSRIRWPILSVDFSQFDASLPNDVIRRLFATLRFWFQGSDDRLVRFIEEVFCRTGFYVPGDYWEPDSRQGGVPSGSVLTNLIDSMGNFWCVCYAAHRLGLRILDHLLQGDDGVFCFNGPWDIGALSDVLLVELGMIMSPKKCFVSDREVHFLQSVHSIDWKIGNMFVGVRPINRFLNGWMKRLEEEDDSEWGPLLLALRSIQQFDNCSAHPSFRQGLSVLMDIDRDNMVDAARRLCNNDVSLLVRATRVRSFRAGGISTKVEDLYGSAVVKAILSS